METEHAETVVEKAVAYAKDIFGMPPADRPPDVVAKPEYSDAPEPTVEDAMRLDPYTTKSVVSADRARREHENSAADAPEQAAERLDRAQGSVGRALEEIQHISRSMKQSALDGRDDLPSDSEMQDVAERDRAADRQEKNRQAQQQSAGW